MPEEGGSWIYVLPTSIDNVAGLAGISFTGFAPQNHDRAGERLASAQRASLAHLLQCGPDFLGVNVLAGFPLPDRLPTQVNVHPPRQRTLQQVVATSESWPDVLVRASKLRFPDSTDAAIRSYC
jgi:hypothetical protein